MNLTNWINYGLVTMSLGVVRRGSIPDHCLTVRHFPYPDEEAFDTYSPHSDTKLEAWPRTPSTVVLWKNRRGDR